MEVKGRGRREGKKRERVEEARGWEEGREKVYHRCIMSDTLDTVSP